MKSRSQPMIFSIAILTFMALSNVALARTSGQTTNSIENWIEDIDHLITSVRFRHVAPFKYGASEDEYLAAAAALRQRVATLSDGRILLELFRLHALLNDSHSEALWDSIPSNILALSALPVRFNMMRDGIYVHEALKEHEELLGALVLRIGGTSIDEVLRATSPIISGDNEMHRRAVAVANTLILPAVIYELGFSSDPLTMELDLEVDGHTEKTVTLEAHQPDPDDTWVRLRDREGQPIPLWLTHNDRTYWFKHLSEEKLLYMQFNRFANDPNESLEAFSKRMFAFIDSHDIDKLVIDMRQNPGGDITLGSALTYRIASHEKVNRLSHFFIIFGRGSKSAAPSFAIRMRQLTNVVFVGEPTGGRPNGYGNTSIITLPNSGTQLTCSQLFVQPTWDPDRRPWITPDITAELTIEDLAENRDPALEAIIHYLPPASFLEFVGPLTRSTTPAEIFERYAAFRNIHRNKWLDVQEEINRIGYDFLEGNRVDDAIEVFEFNIRQYPTQYNTYDSLAEAYMNKGMTAKSIELYKKSFLMGRNNTNALSQLENLGWEATSAMRCSN
ncbi:MAG: hypothetical protein V3S30_02660 [Thermoanaerobaculia bacterium]